MAFQVFAHGITRKGPFHFDTVFGDAGRVLKGSELLEKLVGKTKVPVGGMGSGVRNEANKGADMIAKGTLGFLLQDLCDRNTQILAHHEEKAGLGGVWPAKLSNGQTVFRDGFYKQSAIDFVKMLEDMGLNEWSHINGMLAAMDKYMKCCDDNGVKPGAVSLLMQIREV